MRIPGLRHYLEAPELGRAQAALVLRGVFAAMFLAQLAVALVLAVAMRVIDPVTTRPSPLLGWVLVAISVLELPLGWALASVAGRGPDRRRALSAVLLSAVVLSTPAWFAALALATGQRGLPVAVLWGVLAVYYATGVAFAGRFASRAAQAPPLPSD